MEDLENRNRRNNLIIYGIAECETETVDSLSGVVLGDIFEKKMGIKVNSLERMHRLGRKATDRTRPVIMRFFDFNEKMQLLRNAKKLKNTDYSLSEDYSLRIQSIRKKLWSTVKDSRTPEDKVYLKYDKLVYNRVTYVWDEAKNERRKLVKPGTNSDGGIAQDNENQAALRNDRITTRRMAAKGQQAGQTGPQALQTKSANGSSK